MLKTEDQSRLAFYRSQATCPTQTQSSVLLLWLKKHSKTLDLLWFLSSWPKTSGTQLGTSLNPFRLTALMTVYLKCFHSQQKLHYLKSSSCWAIPRKARPPTNSARPGSSAQARKGQLLTLKCCIQSAKETLKLYLREKTGSDRRSARSGRPRSSQLSCLLSSQCVLWRLNMEMKLASLQSMQPSGIC